MKIHHLNCCTLHPMRFYWQAPEMAVMPCHCLLIETGNGLVLVDTGVGAADIRDQRRLGHMRFVLNIGNSTKETAASQIRQLGFDPVDVKHIICTHLDLDHTGGLPEFPEAYVHVLQQEYDAMKNPTALREKNGYRKPHFAHGPRWVTHSKISDKDWFGMKCIRELDGLPPEIVLIPLPGHSRGHCAVAVQTDDKWLLHCGDAYDLRDELLKEGARKPFGIALYQFMAHVDRRSAKYQLKRLRKLLKDHGDEVTVFAAHEPSGFEQLSGTKLK